MLRNIKVFITAISLTLIYGCASHSYLVTAESEKSNAEAIRLAQEQISTAEARGCKVASMSGGPSLALGIVVGAACIECQPAQDNQKRQIYVVNLLMKCPGGGREQPR